MPQRQLTGGRIRERRIALGVRQADLARDVGISASYLNLIEHNRRRIGGKLLLDLSAALGVEPSALTEGAEAALTATLRDAASDTAAARPEIAAIEDFAARFPGWAEVLADRHRRVLSLEHTVEQLADRLTHDPYLAAAMHEVLSTVTAIRSTAAILVDPRDIEPEWRDRFHRNINEDAARLAQSAQALVGYLDGAGKADAALSSPQDEMERFLTARAHHFAELEVEGPLPDGVITTLIDAADVLQSTSARAQARSYLERYRSDAERLPLARLRAALAQVGSDDAPLDPLYLAARLSVDPAIVMRRLASLPQDAEAAGPVSAVGLASCDASGTLLLRRPIDGFALPRFGSACPRWPLFAALNRPMTPIRQILRQSGQHRRRFRAFAIAQPVGQADYNAEPLFEAHMLILPLEQNSLPVRSPAPAEGPDAPREVGVSCRICPAEACPGRREPSILTDGF
ncbi:short-chain fatty acyl-CoA regulator family protein [Seohaeicola saemankumensis]|uniref:Short-chain fatty acyl-CoA regulator family protein n=1 Tax=Seohaeicola saemankumensis TaxID=481181 RepID=A0ABW3TAT6_9RHOB